MSPLLDVRQLQIGFVLAGSQQIAVDGLDFSINRGKTLVLLGESGSGKSVCALSIMRLLPNNARITKGTIGLDGENLLSLPESRMRQIRGRRITMIFQEPQHSLNPVLTARQQIGETLRCHQGLTGKAQRLGCIELLEAVGIPEPERRVDEYPHQFSGGMKQRIMIAIALAGKPDLLIADEPTTALDVTVQAQILALLKQIQADTGMAILFITHDLAVAAEMADHIAIMRKGRILEAGDKTQLIHAPRHSYTRQLFHAIPSRDKRDRDKPDKPFDKQASPPLLSVAHLKVYFPIQKGLLKRTIDHVKAIDDVSLKLHTGETLAIVGESGSGKTTLGRSILQLLPHTGGNILFEGEDLRRLSTRQLRRTRSKLQIIFQDPYASMNPKMMVGDIIREGMLAQKMSHSGPGSPQQIDRQLRQVGLSPEHKYRYPHEFSGGQRQRICIARALTVNPRLIICDEPTSALDVSVQAKILDLLKQLQQKMGLAFLFITHDIGVVEYMAHHVIVLYKGRIVEQGQVDQVLLHPRHPYTQKLIASVPRI